MASITDDVVEWLTGLEYTGSLADMQRQYLVDLAVASEVSTEGSLAYLQFRLGLPVGALLTIPEG